MMDADGRPTLVLAMRELGLAGEASPFGRWIRIWGAHGPVYVAQAAFGRGYYTWDDAAHRRCVGPYDDAREAIRVGLRRAEQAQVERAAAQRDREEGQESQPGQEWDGSWQLHLPEMINKRAVRARPRREGRDHGRREQGDATDGERKNGAARPPAPPVHRGDVRARLGPRGPGRPAQTTLAWGVEETASPIGRP